MKRILLFLIISFFFNSLIFSSEYTEDMLDRSIEEFSQKNYESALKIIEDVLKVEPENSIALMYKKTIEDVISIDEEIISELNSVEVIKPIIVEDKELIKNSDIPGEEKKENSRNEILSLSTYIGNNLDDKLVLEYRAKLILGLPILEIKFLSTAIDYDIINISFNSIPLDEMFNYENYNIDFGIGYRYKPFEKVTEHGGFFDLKLGVTNFSRSSNLVIPYIGFDTESFILSPIANNIIFNNIWVGGSGSLYSYNGDFVNNFKIEAKAGITFGIMKLGIFYNNVYLDAVDKNLFNDINYGVLIGLHL